MEMKPLSGRRRAYDRILRFLLYFCAALTCALLLFIIGYIFFKACPMSPGSSSAPASFIKDTIGILPNILNTVYLVGVTLIITLPLGGSGAAIYLTEYARNRRLVAAIEFATETLTGIPSINLRPGGHALFLPASGASGFPAGRLADSGDRHHPNHHPHHPGVPQDRPSVLPGGGPGLGRGQVAYDSHRGAPLLSGRHRDGLYSAIGRIVGESAACSSPRAWA